MKLPADLEVCVKMMAKVLMAVCAILIVKMLGKMNFEDNAKSSLLMQSYCVDIKILLLYFYLLLWQF